MVVTAGELYGGMDSGPGAGPVDRKRKAEGVDEKGGHGEVPAAAGASISDLTCP